MAGQRLSTAQEILIPLWPIQKMHFPCRVARIQRHGSEPYVLLQQSIGVHPSWHNKTVQLSGSLRGEDINRAGGTFVLRVGDGSGQILAWNFMQNTRVKGTQDWKSFTVDLKIPPSVYSLIVGVMLEDGGTL